MIWAKMERLDRKVVYVVLLMCLAVPLLKPMGIPLSIDKRTSDFFHVIEGLAPDARVLVSFDYETGGSGDVHPQVRPVVEHLLRKGIKPIMASFRAPGPMFCEDILKPLEAQGYEYGVDFVNLGFLVGDETAVRNFASDPLAPFATDFRGKSTKDMPVLEGIQAITDFDLIVEFTASNSFMYFIRHIYEPHKVPIVLGSVAVMVPEAMPYLESNQLAGILSGMRAAAEYELLMEAPGSAVAKMDAQSLGHLAIILFIVLGNVAYRINKNVRTGSTVSNPNE
jgi:hypothetical protein